jgi:Domain of Unknown Function with PDB structure (DUF3857)/Domain of Unknown Function with PDB structure (DUF3858)/Transglutaminase-like superfamily
MLRNRLIKTVLLLAITVSIPHRKAFSQQKTAELFAPVSVATFGIPLSPVFDSSSKAVIIAEKGDVQFVGSKTRNWVNYVFKKKVRIKIIDKKAFELATVTIYLRGSGNDQEQLNDLQASTYNIEDGKVVETKLKDSDKLDVEITKTFHEKRFTMPDLKEGCIIEYSYTIASQFYNSVRDWQFQDMNGPCLYSEFNIGIPDLLRFVTIKYGIDSFYSVKSSDTYTKLIMQSVNAGTTVHNHQWIMKDVPAFKKEDYIFQPEKYLDKLEFTLAQTSNGEEVSRDPVNWNDAAKALGTDRNFGWAIEDENTANLFNVMQKVSGSAADDKEAARQVYFYVRDNFKCVPNDDIRLQGDLYSINKSHKGSVAELNMLLVALLRQKGFNAKPVLVATRSYGHIPEQFPVLDKVNDVICLLAFGKDSIFLDASNPEMSYGKIPLECYNGLSEIIYKDHSDAIYLDPTSVKAPNVTSVLLVNDENGSGENGSVVTVPDYYKSAGLRSRLSEKEGQNHYLKDMQKDYGPDIEIANLHVDSLDKFEVPVKLNYDISYKNSFDGDLIYFNPVIKGALSENPFHAAKRQYPVELPQPIDQAYNFVMDIPNGYAVDELPKSVQASLDGGEGMFLYKVSKDQYTVQLQMKLKINGVFFQPEDYDALRDFFTMVVKKQNEQIVFKKK